MLRFDSVAERQQGVTVRHRHEALAVIGRLKGYHSWALQKVLGGVWVP